MAIVRIPIEHGDFPVRYVTNYQRVPTNPATEFSSGWVASFPYIQLIGWREKLQEDPIFHGKIYGFL